MATRGALCPDVVSKMMVEFHWWANSVNPEFNLRSVKQVLNMSRFCKGAHVGSLDDETFLLDRAPLPCGADGNQAQQEYLRIFDLRTTPPPGYFLLKGQNESAFCDANKITEVPVSGQVECAQ